MSIANARTVHKLKGRSLDNLILLTLDYTDNWIYIALSRVKTQLLYSKFRGINSEYITTCYTKCSPDYLPSFKQAFNILQVVVASYTTYMNINSSEPSCLVHSPRLRSVFSSSRLARVNNASFNKNALRIVS